MTDELYCKSLLRTSGLKNPWVVWKKKREKKKGKKKNKEKYIIGGVPIRTCWSNGLKGNPSELTLCPTIAKVHSGEAQSNMECL